MIINNELKEKAGSLIKNGRLFAFCPRHLIVERREELWVFPLNIMFSSFANTSVGGSIMGTALYEPDLSSFKQDGEIWTMTYWNKFGGDNYIIITFRTLDLFYRGEKYVDGIPSGSAEGIIKDDEEEGWKLFFFHLTMLGLKNSEKCEFQKL